MGALTDFLFLAPKSLWTVTAAMKLKGTCSLEWKLGKALHSTLKSRDYTLPTKIHIVKAMVFTVVMYGCERWTIKKAEHWRVGAFKLWCWRRFLSPLDCKEFKPVSPKRNQPWIFIGRTGAEASILWSPDVKSWLTEDPDMPVKIEDERRGSRGGDG